MTDTLPCLSRGRGVFQRAARARRPRTKEGQTDNWQIIDLRSTAKSAEQIGKGKVVKYVAGFKPGSTSLMNARGHEIQVIEAMGVGINRDLHAFRLRRSSVNFGQVETIRTRVDLEIATAVPSVANHAR